MVLIAHVSDLHVDNTERSVERTRAVFSYLEALPADLDLVLVTGDIADHGLDAEYQTVRELIRSRHPVAICPGNHDDRTALRRSLLGVEATTGPVNQVVRPAGFVVALCDSSIPGKDEGFIDDETLSWLEEVLADTPDDVPVLVGFHHPPVPLHAAVDPIRQFGEDRLAAVISRHRNVAGLVCGHAHTAASTRFAGLPLLVAPGVVSTLRLPWEAPGPSTGIVFLDQPPALAFHVLDDEWRITTHFRNVI